MATIRNPTAFRLTAQAIDRIVEPHEVIDGLTDAEADAVCASGVFERGVLVAAEPVAPVKADDDDEQPQRGTGRRGSRRGAAEVEETTEDERETRA